MGLQQERAAQKRGGNPGELPRRGGMETGLTELARCQQQVVEERVFLLPGTSPLEPLTRPEPPAPIP